MGVSTPQSTEPKFPGPLGWHGVTWQEWGEPPPEPIPDPVARFTIAPEPSTLGDEVTFDAAGSTPSEISAYEWEVVTAVGDTGTGPVFRYTSAVAQMHVMRLIVRLPDGRSNQSMQQFNVHPPPDPEPDPEEPEPETRRRR